MFMLESRYFKTLIKNNHNFTFTKIPWYTLYNLDQCFSTFFNSRNLLKIFYHLAEPERSILYYFSIFREPRKELAEPRLKNTDLDSERVCNTGWGTEGQLAILSNRT